MLLSISTMPEVISSSAKSWGSMPSSSCFLNWMPEFCSRSMLSCAYMSSLHTQKTSTIIFQTGASSRTPLCIFFQKFYIYRITTAPAITKNILCSCSKGICNPHPRCHHISSLTLLLVYEPVNFKLIFIFDYDYIYTFIQLLSQLIRTFLKIKEVPFGISRLGYCLFVFIKFFNPSKDLVTQAPPSNWLILDLIYCFNNKCKFY